MVEIRNSKQIRSGHLVIGISDLFGIWILEIWISDNVRFERIYGNSHVHLRTI